MRIKKFLTILLTIAMVVSLLPATVFAANNTATTMRLAKTQGTVAVTNATGKKVTQTANMKLYNGYKMKTGAKSYAWISLDDTKVAKLDANSVMEVQKKGKSLTLYLSSGNMFFNVKDPLKSGETFSIKTSTMTTGIRGTSGCVRVISDRVTEVHLLTGQVMIYTEHPGLGVSKSAILQAGQKATSLIDWEAQAVSGEMAEIVIEKLENHEICGVCSKEIANDPELEARIRQEAPHLLPEKAAAEADERLAADEKAAEEKQVAIDEKVAQQVFPEDVDPYFEQEESSGGGGGGSAAEDPSSIRNVATWAELLDAVNDYNAGEGVTRINLTADIEAGANDEPLPDIVGTDDSDLILNLGTNVLKMKGTLFNESDLTITNIAGYLALTDEFIENMETPIVVDNSGTLTLSDGTIVVGAHSTGVFNSGSFFMEGGAIRSGSVTAENSESNFTSSVFADSRAIVNSGTVDFSKGTIEAGTGIKNDNTLKMTGGTIEVTIEGATGISNYGTATLTDGDIYVRNGAANAVGVDSSGTLVMSGGVRVRAYNGIGVRANRNVRLDEGAAIWAYGATAQAVVLGGGDEEAILTRPVRADIGAQNYAVIEEQGEQYVQQGVFNPLDYYEGMRLELGADTDGNQMYKLVDGAEALDYADIDTWEKFVRAINEFNTDTDDTEAVTIKLTASIPTDVELEEGNLAQPQLISNTSKKLIIDLNNRALTLPYTLNNNSKLEITGQGAIYTDANTSTMIFNEGTGATLDVTGDVSFELFSGTAIANAAGTVNMKDGIMHLNSTQTMGIVSDNGAVNMTGGEIILVSGGTTYSNYGIMAANADVTINGGAITESINVADPTYMKNYGISAEGGTVKLTSGSITMNYGVAVNVSDVDDLTLGSATVLAKVGDNLLVAENSTETGYTFSAYNDTHYILQTNGGTDVPAGVTTWTQFAAAVEEFNNYTGTNDQVILLSDDIIPERNEVGNISEIVISNTNDVTLTIDTQTNTLNLPVTMVVNAPLTITGRGNGSNIMASSLLRNAALIKNNDELTLNGSLQVDNSGQIGVENYGTFTLNGVDGAAIYVNGGIGVSVADGTADLKYGTVNVSGDEAIGVQVGADGKLNMNGSAAIYATQPTSGNNYAVYDYGGIIDIESGTIQATGTTSYALFGISWNRLSVDTTAANVSASSSATVISPEHENYTTEGSGPVYLVSKATAAFQADLDLYNKGALEGNTITLKGNVGVAAETEIVGAADNDALTIDLNGYDLMLDSTLFNQSNLNIVGPGRVLAGPGFADSDYNVELIRNLGVLSVNGATLHLADALTVEVEGEEMRPYEQIGIENHGTLNMSNCTITAETTAIEDLTIGVVHFKGNTFTHDAVTEQNCAANVTFKVEREES